MEKLPYTLPLFFGALLAIYLVIFIGRRRTAPGAWSLIVLVLAAAVWSIAYAMELTSEDLATKLFWAKVQYIGIVTIAPAWIIFAIQYTSRQSWLTRSPRNLSLLGIIPIIILVLVWTNEAHGLIWIQTNLDPSAASPALDMAYGAGFWVNLVYSYLLLMLGSIWFASMLLQATHLYRWQVSIALLGTLVPWISNLIYITELTPINLDLTPFAFIIAGLAYSWSLFRFRLLDLLPVAHRFLVDGLSDRIIVLDLQNRIVDLNPAAQQMIGQPVSKLIGHPLVQVLGSHMDLFDQIQDLRSLQTEITMTAENREYCFDLRVSPLLGEQHTPIGRLVILHDITERRQVEEELRQARDELELIVAARTASLDEANRQLLDELDQRKQAELRYQTLFKDAPVMYVIARGQDEMAVVTDCNRLFLDTLGYQRKDVLQRPLTDFYAPVSLTELLDSDSLPKERQLLTCEGQIIEVLIQAVPELDPDGDILGMRIAFLDITQLKQVERKFQELLESAPDAMVIVNEEGKIILSNAQTERVFGYTQEDLLNEHIQILLPNRFHDSHLEHMSGFFMEPRARPMGVGLEVLAQRRDGTEFPAEISLSPLWTERGLQVSTAIRDISERKRAEVALVASEAKFRSIFESSTLGMHIYQLEANEKLVLMEANPAADQILSVDTAKFTGKTIEAAFPGFALTEIPEQFRRVAAAGGTWSTNQLFYKDENISGAFFELQAFQISSGKVVTAFTDITERMQAEEEKNQLLREIQKRREQQNALARRLVEAQEVERKDLARELHDQIGQSLTALDFNLNVIRNQLPDDSPVSDQIHSQVDASLSLVGQTAERIRDVMANLRPPVLDDYGLVAALDWYGTQSVASRGIIVTVDGSEPAPRLAPQVELALFRIAQEAVTNVIRHAQAGQVTVGVETDPDQDTVRLVVADDGIGFNPALRVDPADRQSWGLIGMVERAEAVGAHCWIESTPGQGTQVIVEVNR